jgi:Ca2+-binding RTX toxin-like protein
MATNDNQTPGTEGNDTITGGTGSDSYSGGAGNDVINGGSGGDVIRGDGPVDGNWHFEAYDYDFSSDDGQAFDIETGSFLDRGYVSDFEVDGLASELRGTTSNPSDYGIIYTSTLNITGGGVYRFTTTSDDGSTLQIFDSNGDPVSFNNQTGGTLDYLNNDFHQAPTTRWGDATLDPNETYTIQIRIWENQGGEVLEATVQGPDTGNAVQNLLTSPLIGPAPEPGFTVGGPPATAQGDDTLGGGDGDDTILGDGGNDVIDGGNGADNLDGGAGNDTINGGASDDTITGGTGDDVIRGDFDSATGNSTGVAPTPIGQWTFDNSSDPLDDTAAADNDAILQNGASYNATTGAVDLDGSNDFIEVPHDPIYDLDSATIKLDFNIDAFSGDAGLVSRDSSGFDGGGHFTVRANDSGGIELRWQSDTTSYFLNTPTGIVSEDTDHELVVTLDNATSTIQIYVDGVLQASDTSVPVTLDGNAEPWVLGALQNQSGNGVADVTGGHMNGSISLFEIHDSALTPDQLSPQPPGNDSIDGGAGNDRIEGEGGDDVLIGGSGNDTVLGGDGADTLDGGADDDILDGGQGFDRFLYTPGDGDDTIEGFGTDTGQDLDDGNQTNNDFIDLAPFYTSLRELKDDYDDDGVLNQSTGDYSDNAALNGSLTFETMGNPIDPETFTFDTTNVPCFTLGTRIDTPTGPRRIETLAVGDLVCTYDGAPKPLRWIGRTTVAARDKLAPIAFAPGSIGNTRPLRVSPEHRMLLSGWQAEMFFGQPEMLMAAKHFVNGRTIRRRPGGVVTYLHMLFDDHELVISDGAVSESLLPAAEATMWFDDAAQAELRMLFPALFHVGRRANTRRPCVTARESVPLRRALSLSDQAA